MICLHRLHIRSRRLSVCNLRVATFVNYKFIEQGEEKAAADVLGHLLVTRRDVMLALVWQTLNNANCYDKFPCVCLKVPAPRTSRHSDNRVCHVLLASVHWMSMPMYGEGFGVCEKCGYLKIAG